MFRIPNRQNLLPPLYHTEFSVQKIPTCVQESKSTVVKKGVSSIFENVLKKV